ncbi:hypothetical protein OIU84_009885 [Salix udensis]|uniref:Pentatricopeptide repeat-containing protein n=1 Tax=Salix udensis TaxID=889485 RepID=A0AAD6JJH9_9ROSI|nr:hypothetical protein OIU84_009885 [Salix udensis]
MRQPAPPPTTAAGNTRAAEQSCLALLQACNTLSKLTQIHTHIIKSGLQNNPLVLTKFTATSSDLQAIDYATSFLFSPESDTRLYDTFLYNTITRAYAQTNNLKAKAIDVYKFMLERNDLPNKFTYPFVLKACAEDGEGGVEFARKVFDEMSRSDSVSWSAMIGGYVRVGRSSDAISLFREMQIKGESVQKNVELSNALIDMFAKCGDVDKATNLFRSTRERNIVSWTSVIGGLAMHGRGVEAVAVFEEMIRSGVTPDDVVFIGLLSACSHSGLVDKGKKYFDSMRKEFGIVPKIEHYGCMVDMLCRAGLVKEALKFVQEMPIDPNPVVWRTLINACRAHGELKLGRKLPDS